MKLLLSIAFLCACAQVCEANVTVIQTQAGETYYTVGPSGCVN